MAISHPFFRGDPIGRKAKRGSREERSDETLPKDSRLRETADTRTHHEADGNKPSVFSW